MDRNRFDVNCSILLTDLAPRERPRAARDLGFSAVEFWWPFARPDPSLSDVIAFCSDITRPQMQLVALNLFAGDLGAGDRGVAAYRKRASDFRGSVERAVTIAERTGCRLFHALLGRRRVGATAGSEEKFALKNLAWACERLEGIGGVVLVEPLSGVPDYPVRCIADARRLIGRLQARGGWNVKVLADLYHLSANGEDIREVALILDQVAHVQIADHPGRGAPGTGRVPLHDHVDRLLRMGYTGHIGLEYLPGLGDFGWLDQW